MILAHINSDWCIIDTIVNEICNKKSRWYLIKHAHVNSVLLEQCLFGLSTFEKAIFSWISFDS